MVPPMSRLLPIAALALALTFPGCGDDSDAEKVTGGSTGATGAEGTEYGIAAEQVVAEDLAARVKLESPSEGEVAAGGSWQLRSAGSPTSPALGDKVTAFCDGASCMASVRAGSFLYVDSFYRLSGPADDPSAVLKRFTCPYPSSYCGFLDSSSLSGE